MTTLQKRLDTIRTSFESKAPAEAKAVMHGATEALIDAGLAEHAVGRGQTAPAFELPNSQGELVRSDDLLKRGPLILTFFRGHW